MSYMGEDFSRYGRGDDPAIPIGACERFAGLLDENPNASVRGVEHSADGKDLDIVIGTGNKTIARVNTDFLLSTKAFTEVRAPGQTEQVQGLVNRTAALVGVRSPIALVRPHGSLK